MITVTTLSKLYGDFKAVDHFSLSVAAGEILGIAGVEGNGQTELIEAIAGLRPIEEYLLYPELLPAQDTARWFVLCRIRALLDYEGVPAEVAPRPESRPRSQWEKLTAVMREAISYFLWEIGMT